MSREREKSQQSSDFSSFPVSLRQKLQMFLLSCLQQMSFLTVNNKVMFFLWNSDNWENKNMIVKGKKKLLEIDCYILYKPQQIAAWVTKPRFSRSGGQSPRNILWLSVLEQLQTINQICCCSCVGTQPFLLLTLLDNSFSRTWSHCGFCKLLWLII